MSNKDSEVGIAGTMCIATGAERVANSTAMTLAKFTTTSTTAHVDVRATY